MLSPIGLSVAIVAQATPGAAVVVLACVLGVLLLLRHERTYALTQEQRALRDPLTELANRALLEELLDSAERRCAPSNTSGALLLLDINEFKAINDRHGHACGDRVLCAFAERLKTTVRNADTVARLGGDEFVVLLADSSTLNDAHIVADSLRRAFTSPLQIEGRGELTVSPSIGAAVFGHAVRPDAALSSADAAMYAEKHSPDRRGRRSLTAPRGYAVLPPATQRPPVSDASRTATESVDS
jgi:two-component system, cell cycle response regulator